MKAKEYAKIYNDNPTNETMARIVIEFTEDVSNIAQVRKAQSNDAFLSVLDEQENKWQAFCRLCSDAIPDLFKEIVKMQSPEAYELWRRGK